MVTRKKEAIRIAGIRALIGAVLCSHPHCIERGRHNCCACGARFCADHGTASTIVAQIETAVCWKCGGFNADE